jgi:hypothetical protein
MPPVCGGRKECMQADWTDNYFISFQPCGCVFRCSGCSSFSLCRIRKMVSVDSRKEVILNGKCCYNVEGFDLRARASVGFSWWFGNL